MEVIAVVPVGFGPEHRGKLAAGAAMHGSQKRAFAAVSVPAALDGDAPAIGERERRDIECVGVAVLREFAAGNVIDGPARIRGGDGDFDDGGAQMSARLGSDRLRNPALDLRDHRAAQQSGGLHADTATERAGHFKRPRSAADAGAAKGCP